MDTKSGTTRTRIRISSSPGPFLSKLEIVSTGQLDRDDHQSPHGTLSAALFWRRRSDIERRTRCRRDGHRSRLSDRRRRMDTEDWRISNPDSILSTALAPRRRQRHPHARLGRRSHGNVAVLGTLIDSLRASGYEPCSSRNSRGSRATKPCRRSHRARSGRMLVDVFSFGFLGLADWGLYWICLGCVVLGVARLLFIMTLAAIQREAHAAVIGPRPRLRRR